MPPSTMDGARLNELLGRAVQDMGATLQAPLMVIGERLGLYRALAEGGAATPEELAARTGTAERYVREWLRGQAAGGYVSFDPGSDRYHLTPEQAMLLADDTSPVFLLGGFEVALSAGRIEPRLLEAFRTGDGIGWHEHEAGVFCGTARFYGSGYRSHLLQSWLPSLEGVTERLEGGGLVADVGCGLGLSTVLMAEGFPSSTFIGFDYHEESLASARERARERGLQGRLSFQRATATDFPGRGYDLVTMFDCLHDLGDPVGAALHIRETLAEDGTLMIVEPRAGDRVEENLNPVGRLFYAGSTLMCTPHSLSEPPGRALGAQAGAAAIREVLGEAGFTHFRLAAETPFNLVFEVAR